MCYQNFTTCLCLGLQSLSENGQSFFQDFPLIDEQKIYYMYKANPIMWFQFSEDLPVSNSVCHELPYLFILDPNVIPDSDPAPDRTLRQGLVN